MDQWIQLNTPCIVQSWKTWKMQSLDIIVLGAELSGQSIIKLYFS